MKKQNQKKLFYKKNEQIRSSQVRITNEVTPGIYSLEKALQIASDMELDLVQIADNKEAPICKLVVYEKYLYQQKKKKKEQEQIQQKNRVEVKEIRFSPNTDTHDFNFKLNHAKSFLKKNNKVKASVLFKGREMAFRSKGEEMLLRFANELMDIGKAESMPKMEGRRMIMFISPKK